jgi:hypothetical protein
MSKLCDVISGIGTGQAAPATVASVFDGIVRTLVLIHVLRKVYSVLAIS